jgi:enterochelin esterase-like enzyme
MRITSPARIAVSSAIVVGTIAMLHAQSAVPARGAGVEHIKVHGQALEGNLEGDSPDREVTVYLPPTYATERTRRYPVVYLLHGYGGTDANWTGRQADVPASADKLVAAGRLREMIVVMPNAFTLHKGSMYSSSVTTGDWETYVARDLVAYMDGHYRTIADRASRGLAGASMGGYGAIRIGMKRPDVFSSLYILSACCLTANINPRPDAMAAAEAIRTREAAEEAARGRGNAPSTTLAFAAAWSPNPMRPPLYVDLPMQDGKVRPEIVAKWAANAPLAMIDQYIPNLKAYHAIGMDIGTKDGLLGSNQELHQAMTRFGVTHLYEEYDGDHTNRRAERIEQNVLPFFANNLSFAAKTSSSTRR